MQTAEGKLRLFVAIDRTSKFAFVELHRKAGKMIAAQFLRSLIAAVPYVIHTVLTDNGIQFTNMAHHKCAFHHTFDRLCHRLTSAPAGSALHKTEGFRTAPAASDGDISTLRK